ncbi:MAG: PspC domain-containing protein [Clostridia bacterium]|nr:PspC domain-containing protein [Clostridia bacterium]
MEKRKLYRSKTDKKLLGVLGGFAKYFNIDATVLRIIYVLLSLFVLGCPIIIYLVVALIIPEEPDTPDYQEGSYEPYNNNQN